ncbi:MAG: trehalose-phosphatase [Candidatus Omnitrophota bacterium]
MKYLFDNIKEIEAKIKKAKMVLLACDFDGTLAGIEALPSMVRFSQEAKKIFSLLTRNEKITAGIISGRPIAELKKITQFNNKKVFYAGNHGFEIQLSGEGKFIYPPAKESVVLLKKTALRLKQALKGYEGILVEEKGYSLSIHYRNCHKKDAVAFKKDVNRICLPFVKEGQIKLSGGKKVIEVRPPFDWNKGTALEWIEKRLKKAGNKFLTIYIGDDKTDEDAFAKIKNGFGIYVGRKKKRSAAGFYLPNPKQVLKFLSFLNKLFDTATV